jgi:putative addiction module component (TIGR02574 family)
MSEDQSDHDQSPLPDWQREILDERIAEEDANPDAGSPWHEVKQRIRAHLEPDPEYPPLP